MTLSLKRHICCQVVCSATVVFVLVFLSPFTGNNGWVKEALTLSNRSNSSIGPMSLELQRVLVLFVWCVTTTFYVMQQLMGLNAEFGIRVNPWLVRSVLTAIKRQTVHFPVGVGDLIRPVTSFLTALSMFGFCRVVIIIPPHFRWKARLRVVVQFQLRSLLLKLTASWHLIMSWRPLSCLRPPSLCWTRWWLPPLWRWKEVLASSWPPRRCSKGAIA